MTLARAPVTEGAPELSAQVDEARARLVGLDLGAVARRFGRDAGRRLGGTMVEGTEELAMRVRLGDALLTDPAAIRDKVIVPSAGAAEFSSVASVASVAPVPGEGVDALRNGERAATVWGFLPCGVPPEGRWPRAAPP